MYARHISSSPLTYCSSTKHQNAIRSHVPLCYTETTEGHGPTQFETYRSSD